MSGWLLVFLSRLLSTFGFVQQILWKLNKFDQIKNLPELEGYGPRYEAIVIPRTMSKESTTEVNNLPRSQPRKHNNHYYTVGDYHEAYKSGRLTPSQVAEYLIPLITRQAGQRPNRYAVAYLSVLPEQIRIAAAASTRRFADGIPVSMLDGVPIAVKDEVDLAGHHKSAGSRLNLTNKNDATDWCVQKWQDAGAIILGKTNMHELGLDTTNNNPIHGTPLNPHNEQYYTGGSSGGSACTVAQGITPIALGVDGGGSIRIPSSFCGLWGLKTGQGRVSNWPGSAEGANSVAVSGPMCSNIDDLALAYRIMAQPCPLDPVNRLFANSLDICKSVSQEGGPKYLGIDREWVARSDKVVLDAFYEAVAFYQSHHVYEVVSITIPLMEQNQIAFSETILAESMVSLRKEDVSKLTYPNKILIDVGKHATAADLMGCARLRERNMRHLAYLWTKYPGMLILTPMTPCVGWPIRKPTDITDGYGASDADMSLRSMEYSCFGNWMGTPALTCPLGYARPVQGQGEIPFGIQAIAEWGGEEQLIGFGQNHEGFLGEKGTKRPTNQGGWIDVLAEANKSSQSVY